MFEYSEQDLPSSVFHIHVHRGVLQVAKFMVFLVLLLKKCFRCSGLIGNFCFKVVLSAKHLVLGIHVENNIMLCSSV